MRTFLLIVFWAFTFAHSLPAQTVEKGFPILIEWETYITDHLAQSIPDEALALEQTKKELARENVVNKSEQDLLKNIRTNYWRNTFFKAHKEEITKARFAKKEIANLLTKSSDPTINNPPLDTTLCSLDIVVIIDQSGSITYNEGEFIRAGLLAFIENQNSLNTGNTITFVGMGQRDENTGNIVVDPIHSETITYDPGNLSSHTTWINNTLSFGEPAVYRDSWSTGFQEAAAFPADLIMVITDGDDGNGPNEATLTADAADVLKSAGAHIFVIGEDESGNYVSGSLMGAVQNLVDPSPAEASVPVSLLEVATFDYVTITDNFAEIEDILSVILDGSAAEITSIDKTKGLCLDGEFCFSANFKLCDGAVITADPVLAFYHNGFLYHTIPITFDADGNYYNCFTKQELVDLGLYLNIDYDVFVEIETTEGTITSPEYEEGLNNDMIIQMGPGVVSLTSISYQNDPCTNDEVCFFGLYDLCPGGYLVAPPQLTFRHNGSIVAVHYFVLDLGGVYEICLTEQELFDLGLDADTGYDATVTLGTNYGYTLNSLPYIPGNNNDFEIDEVIIGEVSIIDIDVDKNPCLEAETCFSGNADLCAGLSILPPVEIVFLQNGTTVASAPITLESNGTFEACFTNQDLLNLGLESDTSYDAYIVVNTDGGTFVSDDYNSGVNNDFSVNTYEAEITSVPECVEEGVPFEIVVMIDGWIDSADFENIYSSNNSYTYVSHGVQWTQGGMTRVTITFVSKSCSCEGEILIFDIVIAGCSTPIWLMTHDPIPCCVEECQFIRISDWSAGDCFYYNGDLARPFSITISSLVPVTAASFVENTATCQTDIADLVVTPSGPNTYEITGNMIFENPDCDGHAWLSLILDTEDGCCAIDQQFSFPKGCSINKACDIGPVKPQLVIDGNPPLMTVSINLPLGTTVQVTNNLNGNVTNISVEEIQCGPFLLNSNGTISGGTDCNGIKLLAAEDFDCRDDVEQNTTFSYTISYNNCFWMVGGDYCDITTIYKAIPNGGLVGSGTANQQRSASQEESYSIRLDKQLISVYPNPILSSAVLNFDFTQLSVGVKMIRITDISGQLIETIIPQEQRFSHSLSNDWVQGVYFVVFRLEDGSVESKKLIVLE